MTAKDRATYLANLLYIARSDGALNPKERSCLERIRSEIGAEVEDQRDAEAIVAKPGYEPTPAGRLSDRVRNLEDMVALAQADGRIAPTERNVVASVGKRFGVTPEQVELILSQPPRQAEPTAGAENAAEPAAEAKTDRPRFDYPKDGISVEFAEFESDRFDAAQRIASSAPAFKENRKGKEKWFLATWPRDRILDVVELAEALKGAENRNAYVDGKEVPWEDLFAFVPCMQVRQSAYFPAAHCFGVDDNVVNVWGCKEVGMHWSEYGQWFTHGHFREKDIFVFDKRKIQEELRRNLHKCRFCPYLRLPLVNAVLQLLPSEVKVSRETGWKYRGYDHETPNSIKVTIREDASGGEGSTRTIYARGVGPIGFDGARELLKEAFKKCGIIDVDYQAIVP